MLKNRGALLFDLDGTLLDTAPDLVNALNIQLQRHQKPPITYEVARPYASRGSRGLIEIGFGILKGEADFEARRQEYLDLYAQNLKIGTQAYPGMDQLLRKLTEHKILWGIVTNKPGFLTHPLLEQMSLSVPPACVVSGDTCARSKPAPDSLLYACELLDVLPENSLYVGDSECDVIAAREAGMKVIVARYGYTLPEENPALWKADGYIDTLTEVISLL
jgi:N-acetyl-D-muramate 6-phosphate phosphatase